MDMGSHGIQGKRLVGIYNADGGFLGELRYIWGKISGQCSCSLCAITHGMNPLGKKEWKVRARTLPLPIEFVHRNEMDDDIAALMATHSAPAIVLVGEHPMVLIDDRELEGCQQSPATLEALIREKLQAFSV